MDALHELVRLVTKQKVKSIQIIGNPAKNAQVTTFRYWELYENLTQQKLTTEADIAQHFGFSPKSRRYQRLVNDLEDRLLNTIFFIDGSKAGFNDAQVAFYSCWKALSQIHILIGRGARKAAFKLMKKNFKIAEQYEFTNICWELAKLLRYHYTIIEGDFKKRASYSEKTEHYFDLLQGENKAEAFYEELVMPYVRSKENQENIGVLANDMYQRLLPWLKKYQTYRLHFLAYSILVTGQMGSRKYQAAVESIEKAIVFFQSKNHQYKSTIALFQQQLAVCYTQLKQFEKAEKALQKSLDSTTNDTFNWYKCMEFYITLKLHRQDYPAAFELFYKSLQRNTFKQLPAFTKEFWRILEAWFYFLQQKNEGNLPTENTISKFKLYKFLNQVPNFSKDKRGLNISILIVQILLLLQTKEYSLICDRIKAISSYKSRHLKRKAMFRTNCFIKMLDILAASKFHKKAVERKTKHIWKQMNDTPINIAWKSNEIEIMPYETIWAFVLDYLDNEFH